MPNTKKEFSRRRTLQAFAGLPLIPFANLNNPLSFLSRLGNSAQQSAPAFTNQAGLPVETISFRPMSAPGLSDLAAMATTTVQSQMVASFSDGTEEVFQLSYQPFFMTGNLVPDGNGGTILAGGYYDINHQPILDETDPGRRQFFSDSPDGTSLLTLPNARVAGVKGNTVFAVVQFEYTSRDVSGTSRYGQLPSPIAVLTLDQDPRTGTLKLVKYSNIDTSPVHGLWITCGASLSPWNTHLSSEEYEPDATTIESNAQFQAFSQNLYGDSAKANPYHYGHQPEITVLPDGTGRIKKHYCMGRISHELVQVMPDERTVMMGDDATNGGIFLFIADRARDLSSGTLYVAKWHQKTAELGGSADLSWIRLGHASSAEIKALANVLKASDIVDARPVDPRDRAYTKIRYSGIDNWVKFVPGREQAAAFLETHRYAAFKGGSLGFTKYEGTTVNVQDKVAYLAIASIQSSMIDGTTDVAVKGPRSGAVYALRLRGGQVDDQGKSIASNWVPVDMAAVKELMGEDLATPDRLGNLANPDRVANPDNIKFSEPLRTLFIGEDSGMHVNNFLWAYNIDSKQLSRLLSCPSGAESTGLQSADNVNGFSYIMSNFQHPGEWELVKDESGLVTGGLHAKVYDQLDPLIRANYKDKFGAMVGYLAAVPVSPYGMDK